MRPSSFAPVGRRLLAVASVVATIAYLIWRVATISFDAPLQLAFVTLELHAGVSFVLFTFSVWDTESAAWPGARDHSTNRVAVCIATYNEDEHVLLPTVAAAVALEPAHETWVLDDGDRPWVKAMAEEAGANYLTRVDRSHAKAGNLNHALGVIDAELFAILDADHIPTSNFLRHTIGYFDDPDLALVQTPQDFYNVDSFEHVGDYTEEGLFYRVIQPGKNRWGAAFWCGTSAIVRGDALRSIGGVATESVTEDLLTTIRLHGSGWRTVFHNEVLARGLAPASYKEFLVQRTRWATGAMQIVRSRNNPWFASGLRTTQRLSFTASLSGWFEGIRTVGYLLLALAVVLTGRSPVGVSVSTFLIANLGVLALGTASQLASSNGRHKLGPALLFEFLRIPMSIHAVKQLVLGGRTTFQVTPKGRSGDKRETPPVPATFYVLGGMIGVALIVYVTSLVGFAGGPTGRHVDVAAVVLLGNLALIALAVRRIRRNDFGDERRRARRFSRELRFSFKGQQGQLRYPSTTGAHIEGRIRTGRHTLTVGTREEPIELLCWITSDGFTGSTVEFVPGQYRAQAVMARTLYSELQDMPLRPVEGRAPAPAAPTAPAAPIAPAAQGGPARPGSTPPPTPAQPGSLRDRFEHSRGHERP